MKDDKHNKKAQKLLETAEITQSRPTPWYLHWEDSSPPMIFDAEGCCVAVLSTGVLSGAYTTEEIMANAKRLLTGNLT